jgi:hypothetical protein
MRSFIMTRLDHSGVQMRAAKRQPNDTFPNAVLQVHVAQPFETLDPYQPKEDVRMRLFAHQSRHMSLGPDTTKAPIVKQLQEDGGTTLSKSAQLCRGVARAKTAGWLTDVHLCQDAWLWAWCHRLCRANEGGLYSALIGD